MKRFIVLITLIALAFVGFGQEATEAATSPPAWYLSTEFLVILGGAALVVIEWIIRVVPTSKPLGFALKALSWFINYLITRVPQKIKDKKK
jgi:hypothetical protein